MPIPVLSFGSISTVKEIAIGNVFILPMESETVVAMMVGSSLEHEQLRIAVLSEPTTTKQKRFELLNSAFYLSNTAVVVEDATFVLSSEPKNMLAWQKQNQSGIILRGASESITLGEGQTRKCVDLATGFYTQRPDTDALALAYTAWSLVRQFHEHGRTVTIPMCDWKLPSEPSRQ